MARVDLVEPYAIRFARQSIRDSLMSHGEEVVLLHTFHVNTDQDTAPRCSACWDDIYQANETFDCPTCYGTSFQGGIKSALRAWGIFTDSQDAENVSKRGVWHPQDSNLHTEHLPDLWQRDFVVRVTGWTTDHRPVGVSGIYVMKNVLNESVRTGNRIGQTLFDIVGQRADIQRIAEEMPIYKYPLIGEKFDRYDGKDR